MRRRSTLTIQGKLFAIFGAFILLAAVVIGTLTYIDVQMAADNAELERTFAKLVKSYDAQVLLQQVELAVQQYYVDDDDYALDALTEYSSQIDTYIRETLLQAEDGESKTAVHELQQLKQQHDASVNDLSDSFYAEDWDAFWETLAEAEDTISAMYNEVNKLISVDYERMTIVDNQTTYLQWFGLGLSLIAILVFIGLALIAALVIGVQIFGPLIQIHEAITALRAGEFDPKSLAPLTRREDEIGQLGRAFVTMAEAVRQRRATLDAEIAELRANLEA